MRLLRIWITLDELNLCLFLSSLVFLVKPSGEVMTSPERKHKTFRNFSPPKHKSFKQQHKERQSGLLLQFHYQNIYFILFPIKTLAAIFFFFLIKQPTAKCLSPHPPIRSSQAGHMGLWACPWRCCCGVNELGPSWSRAWSVFHQV